MISKCARFLVLAGALLSFHLGAMAQIPELTLANSTPFVGEVFFYTELDSVHVGNIASSQTGANITWNYAGFSGGTPQQINVVSGSNASYGDPDFGFEFLGQNYRDFYAVDSTGFSRTSETNVNNGTDYQYADPELWLPLPMTYNQSEVDSFYAQWVLNPQVYNREGYTVNLSDAYGTLVLPYGTFSNVLRINTTEQFTDTPINPGPTISVFNSFIRFYLPGTHYPILIKETYNLPSGDYSEGFMLDAQSVANLEPILQHSSFFLYPNPAHSLAQVRYSLENNARVNLRLRNAKGQEVYFEKRGLEPSGTHEVQLDLERFPAGLYLLELEVNGTKTTRKLVVN